MAMLFIYDHHTKTFRCERIAAAGNPLALRGFAQGQGHLAWTDARLLQAYQSVCEAFGPVWIGSCFRRAGRGQSPHYAGLALDMGQGLSRAEQERLRRFCQQSPLFSYVEPAYLTPTWVHAEVSIAPAASPGRGYPFLRPGDSGPHVFLLQDLLCRRGFPCLLSGHFKEDVRGALMHYQAAVNLPANGYADALLWNHLTA